MCLPFSQNKMIKYTKIDCVPSGRMVGKKMFRVKKRSKGTHGVCFSDGCFNRIVPMERYGTTSLFEVTREMFLRDIRNVFISVDTSTCSVELQKVQVSDTTKA